MRCKTRFSFVLAHGADWKGAGRNGVLGGSEEGAEGAAVLPRQVAQHRDCHLPAPPPRARAGQHTSINADMRPESPCVCNGNGAEVSAWAWQSVRERVCVRVCTSRLPAGVHVGDKRRGEGGRGEGPREGTGAGRGGGGRRMRSGGEEEERGAGRRGAGEVRRR
eukprot:3101606-Rhodomonas_salina.1